MVLARTASAIGKGLMAGMIGTAAMTASSTTEMKVRGRKGSETPAEALCKLLGVEAMGDKEKQRLANLVHLSYGTSLGALRGLLGAVGLRGPVAAGTFFGLVWSGELLTLPALELVPPVREWGAREVAIDGLHHCVYALATSVVYEYLDRA